MRNTFEKIGFYHQVKILNDFLAMNFEDDIENILDFFDRNQIVQKPFGQLFNSFRLYLLLKLMKNGIERKFITKDTLQV